MNSKRAKQAIPSSGEIKDMVRELGSYVQSCRSQRDRAENALRYMGGAFTLKDFKPAYESSVRPKKVVLLALKSAHPEWFKKRDEAVVRSDNPKAEQILIEPVPGNTSAGRLLRKQEQLIYSLLLADIPIAQLDGLIERAASNLVWYGADDNPLTLPQQQGIMALVSIRGLYSLLPPPRAIPMPGDAELSQIAIQAFMAGIFFGSAFPEQLRDNESGLVQLGRIFRDSCKKERTDLLKAELSQILAEYKGDESLPEWYEVIEMLPEESFDVDWEAKCIHWKSNGKPRKTTFKSLQNRLTPLRKELIPSK